jgi:hypothetical protein
VRVSLKAVAGVDSVDVSLAKGLASVKMKPANTTTLKQLQDAITRNGFTMKDSTAVVEGTIVFVGGNAQLKVSGSNELLAFIPAGTPSIDLASLSGKSVIVQGVIPEAAKGKAPVSLRYRSIVEEPK